MMAAVEFQGERLTHAHRFEARPPLARMGIALLALLGLLVSGYLSMFKLGYLGTIQCSIGGCQVVQMSDYAMLLGTPVALWGVGAYVLLLVLALAGIQPRWSEDRRLALAIFGFAGFGVLFSAYLTYLEAFVIRAWCQWCVVSAILVTAIFLLSIPGLRHSR
jgi:uncharacterized membrane protein